MKKVLVPVDFSKQSAHALRFAADIATKSGGTIELLHVISLPKLQDSAIMPVAGFRNRLIDDYKQAAEKKFAAMITKFSGRGVKVKAHSVAGRLPGAILEFIEKENIDLVVMGTKGIDGMREWTTGSNTEKIVRTSPVPLIAIKSYTPGRAIRNIVFPNMLDTKNQDDLIIKVKALQNFFGATIHLTWINTPVQHKPDAEIREHLEAFAKGFMLKDYTINIFNYRDEESGITEFTDALKGDLIAIGTHGIKGLRHLLRGSLAEDVVNHVRYPVWTYCTKSAAKASKQK